jgi:hypothetical protein
MAGKRLSIGSRAVAVAVVTEALQAAAEMAEQRTGKTDLSEAEVADALVAQAWDVEYKPNAEKLVLIIDAGIAAPDRMRSTPEDQG